MYRARAAGNGLSAIHARLLEHRWAAISPRRVGSMTRSMATSPGDHGRGSKADSEHSILYWTMASCAVFVPLFFALTERRKDSSPPDGAQHPPPKNLPNASPTLAWERKSHVPHTTSRSPEASFGYIFVGAGTASFAAEEAVREKDPNADILIISDEGLPPYQRPPLSKELWLEGADVQQLTFKDWRGGNRDIFYAHPSSYLTSASASELKGPLPSGKSGKLLVAKVVAVDPSKKTVSLDNGVLLSFERGVLLATGGRPRQPAFSLPEGKATIYRTANDYQQLEQITKATKSILIIGNGFLGSELAAALSSRGVNITQAFEEDGHLALTLPRYLSQWTTSRIRSQGVNVLPNTRFTSAKEDPKRGVVVETSDGGSVVADHVVLTLGVQPNSEVAKGARMAVDPEKGGIAVNSFLEAVPGVYAAGDVISFQDTALGQRRQFEHHDHAVMSGKTAGSNLVGAKTPYTHQPMFWFEVGPEINCEAVGILDATLPTVGVWAKEDQAEKRYRKGVVFYLREKQVVGILMWNLFGKIGTARRILEQRRMVHDISEIAGYFDVHDS
ncbi:hypothetical protein M427DRAFT_119427 [Gonapodya prolifera JEL478]|uniref:FAD/NAD(P)-binding domain-containing protein n=1 Tax=Gonapodya prolifera (strain JEL478) TaxID=1344416 RepID=A0A139AVZ5_GONPJ|nr:hypothetical protein M427DRAFT_119427 [Gonapodya prolifera JEL478]|eukprot:KXS20879.1 hypothetical protein M427DRAFT_119427 [Gonapodya prolifera JEL478]